MPFEEQIFTYEKGYFDADELVQVPDGSFIRPSANVLFNRFGKLKSFRGVTTTFTDGGTRAHTLDRNLVGILGENPTTGYAVGNIIQGVGRSLWFVGNELASASAVRVLDTDGGLATNIGALATYPQVAYRDELGTGWDTPVQVGLAEQETPPTLALTSDTTRGADFTGKLTGSLSCRLARKRKGVISIASAPSNVVTADTDSVIVEIPAILPDGSDTWWLYFTFTGRGSQYSHLLFPIELLESEIDDSGTTPTLKTSGNARMKVVSQHASNQSSRRVEIEFYNNDLNAIAPFDDYYQPDACSFIAQIGNVMLLFGTGTDGTGFDVSYPNNHEAFPPDWRDWLPETPVAICPSPEAGMIWVCTANTTFQAVWAGTTEQTAPVILRQVSDKFGCAGEQSLCNVNGYLFGLSSGLSPMMISPDGEVDLTIGLPVSEHFASYTSNTIVGYDELTNSVVFVDGVNALAYNLSGKSWSAPLTINSDGDVDINSRFSINGRLYLCFYKEEGLVEQFVSAEFDEGNNSVSWNVSSNFRMLVGMEMFDITEFRALLESENASGTVTVASLKNWDSSTPRTLGTYTFTASGVKASTWKLVEVLDYESVGVKVSGTKGGETVYMVKLGIQPHRIRRGT